MALDSDQSAALMNNSSFRGRVKVSCLKYADSILGEAATVPAHNTRLQWARNVFINPDMVAAQIQPPTVMDAAIQAAAIDPVDGDSTADDATVQTAVEAVVNKQF